MDKFSIFQSDTLILSSQGAMGNKMTMDDQSRAIYIERIEHWD